MNRKFPVLLLLLVATASFPRWTSGNPLPDSTEGIVESLNCQVTIRADGTVTQRVRMTVRVNSLWAIDTVGDPSVFSLRGLQEVTIQTAEVTPPGGSPIPVPGYAINRSTPAWSAQTPSVAPVEETILSLPGLMPGSVWTLEYEVKDTTPWRHGFSHVWRLGAVFPVEEATLVVRVSGHQHWGSVILSGKVPISEEPVVHERADSVYRYTATNIPGCFQDCSKADMPGVAGTTLPSMQDGLLPLQETMERLSQSETHPLAAVVPEVEDSKSADAFWAPVKTLFGTARVFSGPVPWSFRWGALPEKHWSQRQLLKMDAAMLLATWFEKVGMGSQVVLTTPTLPRPLWERVAPGVSKDKKAAGPAVDDLPLALFDSVRLRVRTPFGVVFVDCSNGTVSAALPHAARALSITLPVKGPWTLRRSDSLGSKEGDTVDLDVSIKEEEKGWKVTVKIRATGESNPYLKWKGAVKKKSVVAWLEGILGLKGSWSSWSVLEASPGALSASITGLVDNAEPLFVAASPAKEALVSLWEDLGKGVESQRVRPLRRHLRVTVEDAGKSSHGLRNRDISFPGMTYRTSTRTKGSTFELTQSFDLFDPSELVPGSRGAMAVGNFLEDGEFSLALLPSSEEDH